MANQVDLRLPRSLLVLLHLIGSLLVSRAGHDHLYVSIIAARCVHINEGKIITIQDFGASIQQAKAICRSQRKDYDAVD